MMKSPKEKSIAMILLNGNNGHDKSAKEIVTGTMQRYVELRMQQQMLQRPTTRPLNFADGATQFTLSPLTRRIMSTIESNNADDDDDDVRRSNSFHSKKRGKAAKVVTFATHQNVIIRYDLDIDAVSKKAAAALFWYTAQDYARFRSESNDMAAYASGDLDYQQFFTNTMYPCCQHMASTIRTGNKTTSSPTGSNSATSQPLSPTDSDSDSTISAYSSCSSSTTITDTDSCSSVFSGSSDNSSTSQSILMDTTMDASELEMMSNYRGLERIVFRHILQDLKINYIKKCVAEEADNCYFDVDDDENDMVVDDSSISKIVVVDNSTSTTGMNTNDFRQYMFTSQFIAQFVGQIDRIGVNRDNHEFLLAQRKLMKEQQKKLRYKKAKRDRGKSHPSDDHCSDENFRQQTIEI